MKSSLLFPAVSALFSSVLAVPGNVIGRNACPADNCNRDIVAKPSKVADCNSYFLTTVTPVAKTITSTSTVTSYSVVGNDAFVGTVKKRSPAPTPITVIPTNIPAYAVTACTVAERYSSACSCAGAKHSTTTVPVVPVTSVVTKTKTVTVSSFKIAATAAVLSPTEQILVSDDRTTSPNLFGILVTPKEIVDGSGVWRLSTGYGQDYKGRFTQQDAKQAGLSEWIWTDTAANIAANGWIYIDFIVDPFTLALTAKSTDSGNTILQVCQLNGGPYYLDLSGVAGLAEHTTGSPCFPVVLSAVPLK